MADAARQRATQAQQQAGQMMGQVKERVPRSNSQRFLTLIFILTGIAVAVVVGGVFLAGTGLTLALATPLFLFFSPVLVPVGGVVAVVTGGFVSASAAFLSFCSSVAWLYNYVKGRHPVGADKVDAVKHRIADTASHVTEKAREVAHQVAPTA